MAQTHTPRIRMPATAKAGDVVEVKTLISHEMETGNRKDKDGNVVPRKIINKFIVRFDGTELMSVDWFPAISANPFQAFFVRVPKTGTFSFEWVDDDGAIYKAEQMVTVS